MSLLMAAHYAPLVYFAARAQIERIPTSLLWAAQISGANPGKIIALILLPMILPALLAGGFLAFASGIEEYGTPLVIGNRIGFPVISTEIGRLVSDIPYQLNLGRHWHRHCWRWRAECILPVIFYNVMPKPQLNTALRECPICCRHRRERCSGRSSQAMLCIAVAIPYGSMLLTSLLQLGLGAGGCRSRRNSHVAALRTRY